MLSEDEQLKDVGTALMYNIALKEVKTVVSIEYGNAIINEYEYGTWELRRRFINFFLLKRNIKKQRVIVFTYL